MGGRFALIVTTESYTDETFAQLKSPKADADALEAVLKDPLIGNYAVSALHDADCQEVRVAIDEFFAESEFDDVRLLYISGHGVKSDDGRLHFVMRDSKAQLLQSTTIDGDWVRARMDEGRSNHVVVVLDCCYAGAFPSGFRHRADDQVHAIQQLRGKGRAVLTSSSSVQYSYETGTDATPTVTGSAPPSIFTGILVEGLQSGQADRNADGIIDAQELYDHVFDKVRESPSPQRPQGKFDTEGKLPVAFAPQRPGARSTLVDIAVNNPAMRPTLLSTIEQQGEANPDAHELLKFLADDPDPKIAGRARALLASDEADSERSPSEDDDPPLTALGTTDLSPEGCVLGLASAGVAFLLAALPFLMGNAFGRIGDLAGFGWGDLGALLVSMLVVGVVLLAEMAFGWMAADLDISPELRLYPAALLATSTFAGVIGAGWLGVGTVVLLVLAFAGLLFADPDEALDLVPGAALIITAGSAIALFRLPIPTWAAILGILAATGIAAALAEFARFYWALCFLLAGTTAFLQARQPHWVWLDELGRTLMNWLVWRF
ncbi:caspase family protein [Amycolatopsis dendrobii]|uniref:Caspase family protein n=1 Tax=Amycolatopsis dendrobii TaxID=2760662 RepID=A0A7W3W3F0_9PSEU|nr:caspase family protein [Amycolatopsis dendrobii]MBB1158138.1 caspase family protein [Amycolatopsis dendrobii]